MIGTYEAKYVPRSNKSIQQPGPSENQRKRKAISCSLSVENSASERGGDCRELDNELVRDRYSGNELNDEVRHGSIGRGCDVDVCEKSMIGCMRLVHSDAGGEIGVPTAEVGGD